MSKHGWRCKACVRHNRRLRKLKTSALEERLSHEEALRKDEPTESYFVAKEFAARLKECRQLQGTQADVAMKNGVNAWTLQHRELNLARNLRVVSAYAESIGVRVEYQLRLLVDTDE